MVLPSDPLQLVDAAVGGDRRSLARVISIVEDGRPDAARLLSRAYPSAGGGYRVGITGAPGAGKSTLTDGLIRVLRAGGDGVAALAIDPTSPFTGGAVLGDRVRMQDHVSDPGVYIRSMASRGHLGGLAWATPQALRVLDAAGCDVVLVETVGVGQSEVEVAGMADT
ncbi:MAG: methylmalonyl Co-A mutase-associated GTPase MeaB, partial [Acidimicrobiia bacterium]|nr:methylmalonyl Co-A mutase-associated GTPase MeaB [Acidimicrobiia bacterium]